MTEIAWLVQFIMKHKLEDSAKEDCIARIGEVESNMSRVSMTQVIPSLHRPVSAAQLRDEGEVLTQSVAPRLEIPERKKIEVNTGAGVRGPRKF